MGYALCWATHPQYPNDSMNARGRVLHMERRDEKFNYPATYCGMRVVELQADDSFTTRRTCLQCEAICTKETVAELNKEVTR